ncbi:uncharacterized protein LOC109858150 isoform X9 [Pseudomyrmex gracilis]|uniref:uncharacterized protein LOC109858150 isoform X9 n=1 Tax=Pseudomyrmex gracilis TaxID=219809 RepID=UPI00099580C4|nr:uncharacterized protein LOC109858150 isoform X9 [Pseudomyrmex gracilis]
MSEVATKKSINVVSNKKNEVCGVQSNNGLIDLDDLTASNNQLISLCDDDDDDLILTNNTRNELESDDKSLQELIESELALRICSNKNENETVADTEEPEEIVTQPDTIKRIVLDRRQDPVDINTEFIAAESEHYSLIEESYGHRNGHVSPDANVNDVKPEPTGFRDEEEEQVFVEQPEVDAALIIVQKVTDDNQSSRDEAVNSNDSEDYQIVKDTVPSMNDPDSSNIAYALMDETGSQPSPTPATCLEDKHQQEEELGQKMLDDADLQPNIDQEKKDTDVVLDTWSEQAPLSDGSQQAGQFSDNFDEANYQQEQILEEQNSLKKSSTSDKLDNFSEHIEKEEKITPLQDNTSPSKIIEEDSRWIESTDQSINFDNSKQKCLETEYYENDAAVEKRLSVEVPLNGLQTPTELILDNESAEDSKDVVEDTQNPDESSSELSASDSTFIEKTEVVVSDTSVTIFSERHVVEQTENLDSWTTVEEATKPAADAEELDKKDMSIAAEHSYLNDVTENDSEGKQDDLLASPRAPLATPDETETSDVSNACDSESREETVTTSSTAVTSSKGGTKTKKKKIEGVAGNDASSPNLTPRTKKTKKSKKSDLEKENISVKSSFNKFDALTKKTVLHVRSIDAGKVQQQLNAVGQNGEANTNCRSCGKVVFQMEQTKAEGLVWHKNCFRCVQCSKQLNVDNYESHESTLYCKPHFKELFQPKPVEESDQPVRPRKPELIIRENEPKELPPDVVRASDKPDLGLEELSSLNVKSRFQVFEKAGAENTNEIERSPSQIAVKRSPSILSKLAKFQAKGMDIGVADESLNGIPYEESSESEDEVDAEETEEVETEIIKAKRTTRERPISFSKMDDIKNRWESTSQQGRREIQREARKEEIAGIRSRLFMGKQGKMKEMYQQAVAGNDRVTKINAAEEIQHSTTHARSLKERFERGEPIATSDDETDSKPKPEKADEEVIAAGISRKSRSLFLELDASAAKTGRPVTPVLPKTPTETPRRARDAFMGRQVSDDVVRSSDTTEEVHVETSEISNKFKFFETYKEPEKQRKQFRITPPRDGQVKMDSPVREIYRDPDVVRADDRVNDVVHTDTARKMLSIFRQMEENACKEDLPDGPKPLKRFTPPPEDKYAKATASDSEEDEDEEGEESDDESTEERDPNYVRASDKVEDEFLKQAQNAARAKTLRAKFEHWEETDGKVSNHHIAEIEMAQGEQASIESASSLRARFESLGSQTNESPRTPKVKVNRFVEIQTACTDVCESCQKKVYPLEKIETNNKIFHKQCFRCLQCNCILRMDSFTLNNGKVYCIPHFKQLFITRGNYDEGFGVDPHKNKWATNSNNSTSPPPIAVSNGDL